jgi:hypothetical protein
MRESLSPKTKTHVDRVQSTKDGEGAKEQRNKWYK